MDTEVPIEECYSLLFIINYKFPININYKSININYKSININL